MKTVMSTALAMILVSATCAASAETIRYSTKDVWASAGWSTSDECSESYVDVSAYQTATRQTGTKSSTSSFVSAYYQTMNWCTGEYSSGSAHGDGQIVLGQKSAAIKASLTGSNYFSDEATTIEADLNFVANGEYTSKGVSRNVTTTGPVRTVSRQVGSSESATVTGTLSLNGSNLITTDSIWGSLGKSSNGTLEIYKPDGMK